MCPRGGHLFWSGMVSNNHSADLISTQSIWWQFLWISFWVSKRQSNHRVIEFMKTISMFASILTDWRTNHKQEWLFKFPLTYVWLKSQFCLWNSDWNHLLLLWWLQREFSDKPLSLCPPQFWFSNKLDWQWSYSIDDKILLTLVMKLMICKMIFNVASSLTGTCIN